MKKKLMRLLLALMCVLALAGTLSGCNEKPEATEPSETQNPDYDVEIDIGDMFG